MADDETVDEVADRLYGLDPEDFVGARDQAAKDIRARGDSAAAKEVKAMRRPTMAAWAVNRLVRVDQVEVEAFLDVTTELGEAQRTAMAGGKADLRGLSERRQRMMDELVKRTLAIIDSAGGSSGAHEDDLARTFQASSDPDLASQLRAGRLVVALRPGSTLAGLPGWSDERSEPEPASVRKQRAKLERAERAAQDELTDAERDVRTAQAEVDRLQEELHRAERDAQHALRRQEQRRVALGKAREALDE
jgi:hypothetical protein